MCFRRTVDKVLYPKHILATGRFVTLPRISPIHTELNETIREIRAMCGKKAWYRLANTLLPAALPAPQVVKVRVVFVIVGRSRFPLFLLLFGSRFG